MEQILHKILEELQGVKTDIKEIKVDISTLKTDVNILKEDVNTLKADVIDLKEGQVRIEKKLDIVFDQTASLTEFETQVNEKLDRLHYDMSFISQKELENEKQIFFIKQDLKMAK